MSLFSLLQKPAWQHRDPERRAAAVASDRDPELLARLPAIARGDAVSSVRLAALRRIDDLETLAERARSEPDEAVRAVAKQRFLQRLLDASVPLAERQRILADETDAELIAQIAQQAPEASLRKFGLERLNKPSLVAERALRDPDPEIRFWLLGRITDLATLERIAERARKTDKALSREAREKAFALRLASGDLDATRERALAICDELDALRRERPDGWEARKLTLKAEWDGLASRLDDAWGKRLDGYFAAFDAPPVVQAQAPELPLPEAPQTESAEPQPAARDPDPGLAALALELTARAPRLNLRDLEDLERRWLKQLRRVEPLLPEEHELEAQFRAQATALHRQFEQASAARDAALKQLPELAKQLAATVAAGKLHDSRVLEARIEALRKDAGPLPRALNAQLGEAMGELARLAKWQHWSNNKARVRLCDEIEALPGSGLHPDALAAKIKAAQDEWRKLDESEQRPGAEPREHPMHRRFRALCHLALKPAKAYFEKRHELRDARFAAFTAALEHIEQQLSQPANIGQWIAERRKATDLLRRLDELEPSARRDMGKRLREALARIDAAIANAEAEAAEAKRKLLGNLRRDLMHAEPETALAIARDAQAKWKTLPRAARSVDDALWQELRELVAPHFARADAQRAEERASESAQREEARAVLAELAALANDPDPRGIDAKLATLEARWRALDTGQRRDAPQAVRDRRPAGRPAAAQPILDQRAYQKAIAAVREAQARQRQAQRMAELSTTLEAAQRLDQLEQQLQAGSATPEERERLREQIDGLPLPNNARSAIAARLAALASETAPAMDANATEQAEQLVVLAELAAGIDSPGEARELRRRIQIQRLSEKLSGSANGDGSDEVGALLLRYLGLSGIDSTTRTKMTARFAQAVATASSR